MVSVVQPSTSTTFDVLREHMQDYIAWSTSHNAQLKDRGLLGLFQGYWVG